MMRRMWKGRPRGLAELPVEIKNAECYQGADWWLDEANQSINDRCYRLRFEDGVIHFWYLSATTFQWIRSETPPSVEQLTGPVPSPAA